MRTTGHPGGGGITIAIVDYRIPVDDEKSFGHADLQGVRLERILPNHAVVVGDGDHGTIAAARRNGYIMHGVAYNANIVSVPNPDISPERIAWGLRFAVCVIESRNYTSREGEPHDDTLYPDAT